MRAPVVFYNRCNEAAAQLKPGDFDWKAIFAGGVRWFHSGGIFAALSATTAELIIEGDAGGQGGGGGGFVRPELPRQTLEHRRRATTAPKTCSTASSSMWTCWSATRRICRWAWASRARRCRAANPSSTRRVFRHDGQRRSKKHPQIKIVATTLREVHSTNRHSWGAVAWVNGQTFASPDVRAGRVDRVGGGDGFASGFFYGLLSRRIAAGGGNLGWAHGALLTTFPGDTTMATVEQVRAFAKGGSARIQR